MINKLRFILSNCWSSDTCYPALKDMWNDNNKSLGQCAITALIVNDNVGGTIRKCNVGDVSHYFNFINGEIVDLTREQFMADDIINYDEYVEKSNEHILHNEDTRKRYAILSKRVLEYMKKIELIDSEIKSCLLCNNTVEKFDNNTTISFGKSNKILILGEAPANNGWRKSGIAWYDINHKLLPSGKILQKLLDIVNVKLEDTLFFEAIKCYPKDRKYLNECGKNCKKILDAQLDILRPDVILLLGDSATKTVLDINYKKYSDVVGKYFYKKIKDKNIMLIPIYHPSPISPKSYKGNIDFFENLKKTL